MALFQVLTIDTVAGLVPANLVVQNGCTISGTATIDPPAPWVVGGSVQIALSGTNTGLSAMGYQVDEGPVIGFAPPAVDGTGAAPFEFSLTTDDIPAGGQYLLTVYAFDNDTAGAGSATAAITIVCVNMPSIAPPPKGCC